MRRCEVLSWILKIEGQKSSSKNSILRRSIDYIKGPLSCQDKDLDVGYRLLLTLIWVMLRLGSKSYLATSHFWDSLCQETECQTWKDESRRPSPTARYRRLPASVGPTLMRPVCHIHWIVPVVRAGLIGIGIFFVFLPIRMCLIDAYSLFAASAIGVNTVVRSMFGISNFLGVILRE